MSARWKLSARDTATPVGGGRVLYDAPSISAFRLVRPVPASR